MPFTFFDAFAGSECLDRSFDGLDSRTYRLNTYRVPLPGEIGCYASHLALWKHAAAINEPIIILEDDCRLNSNFQEATRITNQLIGKLGFIRLQEYERDRKLHLGRTFHTISDFGGYELKYLSIVPLCLLGYAISPSTGLRLAESSKLLSSPVDKFVQRTWEHGNPVFALSPACVTASHHDARSTIGNRPRNGKKTKLFTMLQRAHYKIGGELRRRTFDMKNLERLQSDQERTSNVSFFEPQPERPLSSAKLPSDSGTAAHSLTAGTSL